MVHFVNGVPQCYRYNIVNGVKLNKVEPSLRVFVANVKTVYERQIAIKHNEVYKHYKKWEKFCLVSSNELKSLSIISSLLAILLLLYYIYLFISFVCLVLVKLII